LIETKAVAQKTNGQFVYSYLNLDKVFTQGIEAEAEYKLKNNFSIRAGYQFLDAEDKQVIQDIKNGKIYGRNPQTLFSYQLKLEDYGGLFNRSKHSGNFKIQYTNIKYKFKTSTWFTYKGKYGLADKNGNLILDSSDEYVKGYGTFNFSVTKEISTLISTQFSAQNIFNYTDVKYIPSMPGATYMSTLRLNIIQNKNQQQNKNKK
jgi:outer membrane receptor for ferrienterochelin and colicins